jgi:hypothetical protein
VFGACNHRSGRRNPFGGFLLRNENVGRTSPRMFKINETTVNFDAIEGHRGAEAEARALEGHADRGH